MLPLLEAILSKVKNKDKYSKAPENITGILKGELANA